MITWNTIFSLIFSIVSLWGMLCCCHYSARAQDSLLTRLITENIKFITYNNSQFSGAGWDYIKEKSIQSSNVLVGEDHFSNEIPAFVKSLSDAIKFDNFYIELDPYSAAIINNSLKKLSASERETFNKEYGHLFSFYSLKPEYSLLTHIMNKGINLLGADQIVMYADKLICQELLKHSTNKEAQAIYRHIIAQSGAYLEKFYANPQNPMYFMTPEFSEQLNKLSALQITGKERGIIEDMKRSVRIYQEQNHKMRVQLIMNQLMKDYPVWGKAKNLFKYGANHLARGESFLDVFDIGNIIANISESNYSESFHMMIVGKSGMLGSPLKNFPASPINIEQNMYLKILKPFFAYVENNQKHWSVFDLRPLRKALWSRQLVLTDVDLARVIKGFDVLIVIPEVSAAVLE